MADARRHRILQAITDRLTAIRRSSGFRTDAGCEVHVHEVPVFGPTDSRTALIAVVVQDDEIGWQAEHLVIGLPVEVQAIVKVDNLDRDAWQRAEAVLADIKEAMELTDRRLGGLIKPELRRGPTRVLPREPGTLWMGLGVRYEMTYAEVWGGPAI